MAENPHTVTKAELSETLSRLGLSRRQARQIVDHFFSELASALRRGEIIHLVGFGSFHYKTRRARRGRNPRTGQAVEVPAKTVVQFRPGSWLKGQVRGKDASK